MKLKEKYGSIALIAGGSEGIGAAFAHYLAKEGMDLVLVARGLEKLEKIAQEIRQQHAVQVSCIACDLSAVDAMQQIQTALGNQKIDFLVYNAALSYIGHFEENSLLHHQQIAQANMVTPMNFHK